MTISTAASETRQVYRGEFGTVQLNAQSAWHAHLGRSARPLSLPMIIKSAIEQPMVEDFQPAPIPTNLIAQRAPRATFGVLVALFLSVAIAWFSHANAFAGDRPAGQAAKLVQAAHTAWHTGDLTQADRLYSEAFSVYASSGYPAQQLAQICEAQAKVNQSLGRDQRAQQLAMQAQSLKSVIK
jgi:hypothetical protein